MFFVFSYIFELGFNSFSNTQKISGADWERTYFELKIGINERLRMLKTEIEQEQAL